MIVITAGSPAERAAAQRALNDWGTSPRLGDETNAHYDNDEVRDEIKRKASTAGAGAAELRAEVTGWCCRELVLPPGM
eukprot:gene56427-28918_t